MISTFLFVDTEFTSLEHPELVSLGVAASDGREFYAERSDFPRGRCSAFVVSEVLPKLGYTYDAAMSAPELSRRLGEWLDPLAGRHLIVAHDYAVDAQLFMGIVPEQHRGSLVAVDVRRAMSDEALAAYFEGPGVLRHHALHDARALRHACASWKESMLQDIDRVQRELASAQVREQLAFWRTRWPALGDLHAAQAISQNMLCGVIECARSAVARS